MASFATYSLDEEDLRTAVRVADNGAASLLITGRHGELLSHIDKTIDPQLAAALVADVQSFHGELPNDGGEVSFGVGEGEGAPSATRLRREQMPPAALDVERRMRDAIAELRGIPAQEDVQTTRPNKKEPWDAQGFAAWTAAFFCCHFLAEIIGAFGLVALINALGIGGILLSLPLFIVLMGLTYFLVGRGMRNWYNRSVDPLKPAMAAVVLPTLFSLVAGQHIVKIGIAWVYPFAARWGAER